MIAEHMMNFFIITPSFNQLDYLKRCSASVRDQQRAGIQVYHHIQDAVSTDGTAEWLNTIACSRGLSVEPVLHPSPSDECFDADNDGSSREYRCTYEISPDEGMYDAINKGVQYSLEEDSESQDSIVAWLNCDEQYLPDTLQTVAAFFAENPDMDILFGGMLMVNSVGELLAARKAMPVRERFLQASYLYNFSCAMFVRESMWRKLGGVNNKYRDVGDEDLVRRALRLGAQIAIYDEYFSTFTYSDTNLSSCENALNEHEDLKKPDSGIIRFFRVLINGARLFEKFLRGGYRLPSPLNYSIFVDDLNRRAVFSARKVGAKWPDQKAPYLMKHRLK